MESHVFVTKVSVPDKELDGIGLLLMKLAQIASRRFRVPVEDAFQEAVAAYLTKRNAYDPEKGARTTFVWCAVRRHLERALTKHCRIPAVSCDFDVAVVDTECDVPESLFAALEKYGRRRDRLKAMRGHLRGLGWTEKEIAEVGETSYRKRSFAVLCNVEE